MDIKVAFNSISEKVYKVLEEQGFKKEKIASNENELVSLFTSEHLAYSVIYYKDKSHMVMRSCDMTEDGPDNDWKVLATWMFNPEEDGQKEADSIANDFVENCSNKVIVSKIKTAKKKKKKKSEDGNADPIFLAKRFVTFFPEIKEEITAEEDYYYPFRAVTFTRASIVPRLNDLLETGNKQQINKICQLLSTQYSNGDVDTRSIITIVILNSIPKEKFDVVYENLSEELQKAWKYALKYKDKKVKPEKPKKKKVSMVERLQAKQQ